MTKSIVLKFINISVFKKLSIVIVGLLLVIQGISYVDTGGNVCGRLLKGGTLVDIDVWHPTGCMIHNYKPNDGSTCLKRQKIAFVGDKHMRSVYKSFMTKFFENSKIAKKGTELKLQEANLAVDFYWRPYLDSDLDSLYRLWLKNELDAPNIIIQSTAMPGAVGDDIERDIENFRSNLTQLQPLINYLVSNSSQMYWMLQAPEAEALSSDHVDDSDDASLGEDANSSAVNRNLLLIKYNEAIESILGGSGSAALSSNFSIVNSPAQVASQTLMQSKNGFSHPGSIAELTTQILMNLFCNDVQRPIDGSCCQRPPTVTFLQKISFIVAVFFMCACALLLFTLCCVGWSRGGEVSVSKLGNEESSSSCSSDVEKEPCRTARYDNDGLNYDDDNDGSSCKRKKRGEAGWKRVASFLFACARFSLILFYFYVCDRSDVFMKANKHFTVTRFCVPLIYLILIGIFAINRSTKQSSFFNQDQSDEWRGWMILFVLVYHMTGAYEKTWITMHYQLMISTFLFISGYTNFNYYWNTGDFSIRRMFGEVLRSNLLAVLLCVVMNRTYQFYFFVPLTTFWFLVLYFFMAIPPRAFHRLKLSHQEHHAQLVSSSNLKLTWICSPYFVAIFKFTLMVVSVWVVSTFQHEFSYLFTWWPIVRLFEQTRGSVEEWWRIVQLDRYSMIFGAFVSFLYQLLKRFSVVDDLKQGCLFSTKASLLSFIVSLVGFTSFSYWSSFCETEAECGVTYTFVCLLPMISFLTLRNIPGYIRAGFSSFFAWFGTIYLELFISQYHIWSAADGKGVLVVTSWPTLNLLTTTLIFVCVAHETHQLTCTFTGWFVNGDGEGSVRRLIVRVFLLLAVVLTFLIINDVTNSRSES